MSRDEQKSAARRWAKRQIREAGGWRSGGLGQKNVGQKGSGQDLPDAGKDPDAGRKLTEVPTGEIEEMKKDLRRRRRRVRQLLAELRRVGAGLEEEPVGLRRRKEALREERGRVEQRIEELKEEISRRPEEEQELREALRDIEEAGRRARLADGQKQRRAGIEKARALLKASRLRGSIRGASILRGESHDIENVNARMEAEGLEEPLETLDAWGPNDKPDVGEGGKAVLAAGRHIADAARVREGYPGYERCRKRSFMEAAKTALKKLSKEERGQVRGELIQRGKPEYERAERDVRRDEKAEKAKGPLERILSRAEEKEKRTIARAEALDEAQRRFEGLDEAVQERLREKLSGFREGQLKEAVRPGRPGAEEIRAGKKEGEDQGQSQGQSRWRGPQR